MIRLRVFTPAGFVMLLSLVLVAGGLYAYESLAYAQRQGYAPHSGAAFAMVVLPDTQVYTNKYPQIFEAQTAWIAKQQRAKNIVYVTHVGDVVEHAASSPEWARASKAMARLDGVVPYGIAPGNHDLEADGAAPLFSTHFPLSRLQKYPGVEAFDSKNSYRLLSAGGTDFIAFNLEFCPPDAVLGWTNQTLDRYTHRQAIVTTHSLVNARGDHQSDDECREFDSAGHNGGVSIWRKLVSEQRHPNLLFFFNGHDIWTKTGAARRTDVVGGRPVHQLLSDYQHLGDGGDGYLRLLTFMPSQKLVKVETYSPYLNSYLVDRSNDFSLPLP